MAGVAAIDANVEVLLPAGILALRPATTGAVVDRRLSLRGASECRRLRRSGLARRLLDAAVQNPDCAFFSCQLLSATDPARLDGTGDVYHVSGRAWRRDWGQPVVGGTSSLPTLGPRLPRSIFVKPSSTLAASTKITFAFTKTST